MKTKRGFFTTVTPLSKALAMFLFILLPFIGFYFGAHYYKTTNYTNNSSDITWKKYDDEDGYFSFKYPSNWRIDYEGHAQDDPDTSLEYKRKKDIRVSSTEGTFVIRFVENYGGACGQDLEKIQLKNDVLDVCHIVESDQERWGMISRPFNEGNNFGFQLDATADPPALKNRETVLRMLSSLEIHKK